MTKYCRRVIGFLYADSSVSPPLFVRGIQFLHTLFRGNDEELAGCVDFFTRSFAGMTKYCWRVVVFLYADSSASPSLFVRGVQFLHTLFRGNDEVLSRCHRLSLRKFLICPAVICERHPISSRVQRRGETGASPGARGCGGAPPRNGSCGPKRESPSRARQPGAARAATRPAKSSAGNGGPIKRP